MQRVKFSLACLLCLTWAGVVSAQTELEPNDTGVVALQDFSGGVTLSGTYFDVRHLSGSGVGYTGGGYTQLGAFVPVWINDDNLIAPVGRMTISNDQDVGGSLGGVFRHYRESQDRIYGFHLWYDNDHSAEDFDYNQFGFGFESLGQWLDVRSNVYVPTTNDKNEVRPLGLSATPIFSGNGIDFLCLTQFQEALNGADVEIGGPLSKRTPWLRGYIGVYAYDSPSTDPVGVRAHIDAMVSNDLTIGVQVTEDKVYGTNVNALVDFRFSGWLPTRFFPQLTTYDRMLASVHRNWRISVQNYNENVPVAAVNPDTGLPYFVVWVDSANPLPGGGNGTFQNPYKDFQPSQPYPNADLILVRVGNSGVVPYNGPIQLFDNQRLLGQGCEALFNATASCGPFTVAGTFNVPGFEDTGVFPTITAPGNIITLADNNEVAGFNLVNAGGLAITNNAVAGSNNFDLHCLTISGNQGGIFLANTSGTGIIGHAGAPFQGVHATDNVLGGISVETSTALDLVVQNSSSNSTIPNAQAFGLQVTANNATLDLLVNGFQADSNGQGFQLFGTNSDIVAVLDTVSLTNNQGFGMFGSIDGGSLALGTTTFAATDNLFDNVNLTLFNGALMDLQFNDAVVTGSLGGSGMVISNSAGAGTILIGAVDASFNALHGLQVISSDGAAVFTDIVGPFVSVGNGLDGMNFQAVNSASLVVDATNSPVSTFNGRHGLSFSAINSSFLSVTMDGGVLDFNGQNAALVGSAINGFADFSTVNAVFTDTTGSFSGADGMFLSATNGALMTVSVTDGTFANSGQNTPNSAGINVQADFFSQVFLDVVNTPMHNNPPPPDALATQADGLRITANNVATVTALVQDSDLSDNLENAIDITTGNFATVLLGLTNSNGNRSGADGILINSIDSSTVNILADNSTFNDSGANGVNAFIRSGADVGLTMINGSFIDRSGRNGVFVDIAGAGSSFTGIFQDGSISDSGQALLGPGLQDAIHILASDQATVDLSLINTPTTNTLQPINTPQQRALRAEITLDADLTYFNQNGDMSFNQLNAVSVLVDGFGSTANLFIDTTPMNNSGETGMFFVASNGGFFGATILNSSLDSSGADGVQGDGIRGLLNNSGTAFITLLDSPVTNAFEDAVHIEAQDAGTAITMLFDNSPLDDAGLTTAGNALDLFFLNGAVGVFTLQNGSTAINAGGDALLLFADGLGTDVTVNALESNFNDSSQTVPATFSGINATVINSAIATLNFVDTPVTNTFGNLPQLNGMVFSVQSNAQFFATFTSPTGLGTLGNHFGSGIVGTVTTDGLAVIIDDSTPIDANQLFGAAFDVNTGGDLVFDISNSSISNNGASGIFAAVDGAGSTATIGVHNSTVDNNGLLFGGSGIDVVATNGGTAVVFVDPSSVSNNANRGISLLIDTGSTGLVTISDTTIDGNGEEGIRAEVLNGSLLAMSVTASSVSNNSIAGNFDSVRVIASGAGTFVETLFNTVAVDQTVPANGLNGFNYTIDTGASVLAQFRGGVTSTGNANGSGLLFNADTALGAFVYMEGINTFSDNGAAVVGTALIPQAGAGVFFNAVNTTSAGIRFAGNADNNGNAANPFADVDGDGDRDDDGLYINFDTVAFAAVDLNGTGSISGNVGDGIDIQFTNVGSIQQITVPSFLTPPDVTIGTATASIIVDNLAVSGNGGAGISIIVDGANLSGGIAVTNSEASSNGGDGLFISLNNVTGTPDVFIDGNGFNTNGGHGIDLVLNNSPLNNLTISNNAAVASTAQVGALILFGDFGNDQGIQNTSAAGITITDLVIDLTAPDFFYDSIEPGISFPFDPDSPFGPFGPGVIGDTATTGLTAIDGQPVQFGTVPLADPGGVPYPGGGKIDDSHTLQLSWNDFDPGETYDWDVDMDTDSQTAGGISGSDLFTPIPGDPTWTGPATATVTFSTGDVITQAFGPVVGDPFAAQVLIAPTAVTGGISGNQLDGIHIEMTNSDIANVLIDNNLIDANGASGAGHGVNFATVLNSALGAAAGTLVVSNNTITNNAGDGFRLVNPGLTNATIFPDFTNNTISNNTGTGVNIQLVAGLQNITTNFTGNTINQNTGGPGINIDTGVNAVVTMTAVNNTINGNAAQGIDLVLQDGGQFISTAFHGNTIGTAASRNGDMGVRLVVPNNASFNWQLGDSTQNQNNIGGNTDAGVGITMTGNATGVFNVQNSTFDNTQSGGGAVFGGVGLGVSLANTSTLNNVTVGDAAVNNTGFNDNDASGLYIEMFQSSIMTGLTVQNSTFTGNGIDNVATNNDGFHLHREADAKLDDVLVVSSIFDSNNGNGIDLELDGGNVDIETAGPLLINIQIGGPAVAQGNTFNGAAQNNGIGILATADVTTQIDIQNNTMTNHEGSGINATSDFFAVVTGTWQDNQMADNTTDGITMTLNRSSQMDLDILNNTIDNSGRHGISVLAQVGSFFNGDINNNTIDNTGVNGVQLVATGGALINIASLDDNQIRGRGQGVGTGVGLLADASVISTILISSARTTVREFGSDGVSLLASDIALIGAAFEDLTSTFNGGRGVEVINTDNAFTDLTINGTIDPRPSGGAIAPSRIEQNGLNGIYVENNAGAINTFNQVNITVSNTSIRGNGITTAAVIDDERNGVWLRVGTSTFGQVNADFQTNFMSGNQNIDFVTESFIATPNPGVASPYTSAAAVVSDPLSRLGLIFRNNEGDQIDVTRFGATYNNADQFKSPFAFFDNTNRLRNAQRLTVDFPPGTVGDTNPFPIPDFVQAAPAPTATTFAGSGAGEGFMPNQSFLNLGVNIGGVRDITAYNNGNNQFTVAPAAGAAFAVGTPFLLFANEIAGVGRSTFRTPDANLAAGGNVFGNVITDFTSAIAISPGNPDGNPLFSNPQTFTWSLDATPFTFEP